MNKKSNGLMLACFITFYALMLASGVYTLIMGFIGEGMGLSKMFLGAKYDRYVYGMTVLPILAFMVLFPITLGRILALGTDRSYKMLIITAGVILIPSFLRTQDTIVVLNYAGYVFLLLALLLRYSDIRKERCLNFVYTVACFIYLCAFLLTIPTVFKTVGGNKNETLYTLMALGSILLIAAFTFMCLKLFSDKYKVATNFVFFLLTIAVNGAVIAVALSTEEITSFLFQLIAVGVTTIAFVIKAILNLRHKKKIRAR